MTPSLDQGELGTDLPPPKLVWARSKGWAWYPCHICDAAPAEVAHQLGKPRPGHVLVYFIHVNQYAYVNDVDEDFVGKLNELEPKMKQRVWHEAVHQAKLMLGLVPPPKPPGAAAAVAGAPQASAAPAAGAAAAAAAAAPASSKPATRAATRAEQAQAARAKRTGSGGGSSSSSKRAAAASRPGAVPSTSRLGSAASSSGRSAASKGGNGSTQRTRSAHSLGGGSGASSDARAGSKRAASAPAAGTRPAKCPGRTAPGLAHPQPHPQARTRLLHVPAPLCPPQPPRGQPVGHTSQPLAASSADDSRAALRLLRQMAVQQALPTDPAVDGSAAMHVLAGTLDAAHSQCIHDVHQEAQQRLSTRTKHARCQVLDELDFVRVPLQLFDAAVGASEAPQQAEPAAAAGDAVVLVVLSVNGRLAPSLLPCMLHRRDDLRGQPMCLLSGLQAPLSCYAARPFKLVAEDWLVLGPGLVQLDARVTVPKSKVQPPLPGSLLEPLRQRQASRLGRGRASAQGRPGLGDGKENGGGQGAPDGQALGWQLQGRGMFAQLSTQQAGTRAFALAGADAAAAAAAGRAGAGAKQQQLQQLLPPLSPEWQQLLASPAHPTQQPEGGLAGAAAGAGCGAGAPEGGAGAGRCSSGGDAPGLLFLQWQEDGPAAHQGGMQAAPGEAGWGAAPAAAATPAAAAAAAAAAGRVPPSGSKRLRSAHQRAVALAARRASTAGSAGASARVGGSAGPQPQEQQHEQRPAQQQQQQHALPVSIAGKGLQHQSQHHQSQQLLAAAAQQQQQQAPAQAAAAGQPEQDGAAGASPALPDSQCLSDLPLSQFAAQLAREQRLSDQLPRLSDSSQEGPGGSALLLTMPHLPSPGTLRHLDPGCPPASTFPASFPAAAAFFTPAGAGMLGGGALGLVVDAGANGFGGWFTDPLGG